LTTVALATDTLITLGVAALIGPALAGVRASGTRLARRLRLLLALFFVDLFDNAAL
jgi:hypothetical protein